MPTQTIAPVVARPTSALADRVVGELLTDGIGTAVETLLAAVNEDPGTLCGLALIVLGIGELVGQDSGSPPSRAAAYAGQLVKLIETRPHGRPDARLAALRALAEAWAGPNQRMIGTSREQTARASDQAGLTQRQRQVLALLSDGLTVDAIARRLCLSPRTVGKHLERMYRRLGTSDRLSTVLRAERIGLLSAIAAD